MTTKTKTQTRTKICRSCGRSLPVTEFYRSVRNRDGLYSYCKNCNRLRIRAYQRGRKPPPPAELIASARSADILDDKPRRRIDRLLVQVDDCLRQYGPRRALDRLGEIALHLPAEAAAEAELLRAALQQMIDRHQRRLEYNAETLRVKTGRLSAID